MRNKFNKFKLISRVILIAFLLLSTIQTLLDVRIILGLDIPIDVFVAITATTIIPIFLLIFIMSLINNKTKYASWFIINDIRFIIKMLVYISVFAVFSMWSVLTVSLIGFYFQNEIIFSSFSSLLLYKTLFAFVYAIIVSAFFWGISDLKFKKKEKK